MVKSGSGRICFINPAPAGFPKSKSGTALNTIEQDNNYNNNTVFRTMQNFEPSCGICPFLLNLYIFVELGTGC